MRETSNTTGIATEKTFTRQIFTSGSGTYRTPVGVKYIHVVLVAGGGGGGAGGGYYSMPTNGGNSTFGTFMTCYGGSRAELMQVFNRLSNNGGGAGGSTVTPLANVTIIAQGGSQPGAHGGGASCGGSPLSPTYSVGAQGGCASLGGYYGMGGRGGYPDANAYGSLEFGAGGGAGGYAEVMIQNPDPSYNYSIGAAGGGGSSGYGGSGGSGGGYGILIVTEYYK